MSLVAIEQLTIRIGGRTLLADASLVLAPGQRVGLVGPNGAGKSTLLRAIAGQLEPDGGRIVLAARARLGFVRQEAPGGAQSLIEEVLAADTERAALLRAAENGDGATQADIHERLRAIGADAAPARAAAILAGLGFDEAAQARPLDAFSGGWRMRVALASVLFANPDLLLLDEPTNHLDLEATLWLEGYLERFPGGCIIVSHDRGLLERAVRAIVHLERGKLSLTPGGFEEFVRIRTERALQQNRTAERVAAQRAHMQSFVDRFRASATKARQAQARLKALQKLPVIESVLEAVPTRFNFPDPGRVAPPMLVLEGAAAGYDGRAVLRGLDARLDQEDRVALLGPNGRGKSTLAKLLAGQIAPLAGRIWRAPGIRVGFFAQHQEEALRAEASPVAHMPPTMSMTESRGHLARFGLDADRALTPVRDLSGGEKARLLLALATRDAPHLLILDEPTNHLDMDARDALVRALADFGGAVLLISHDPALIEAVADRLWLVADGTVRPFEGDMAAYRQSLLDAARPEKPKMAAPRTDRRDGNGIWRRRAREAEARMAALGAEKTRIEARLADSAIYLPARATELREATRRLADLAPAIEAAETDWLAAEEALAGGPDRS